MHVIACNEIYYIVLQFHYMSLHRGGFADVGPVTATLRLLREVTARLRQPRAPGRAAANPRHWSCQWMPGHLNQRSNSMDQLETIKRESDLNLRTESNSLNRRARWVDSWYSSCHSETVARITGNLSLTSISTRTATDNLKFRRVQQGTRRRLPGPSANLKPPRCSDV